jgi:tRNA pseudouridine38-40 synthase
MPDYRVVIEYDGRGFVGWQRQKNGASVQQCIEEALFSFCGEKVRIQGAGRTDAGVHALGQVANFSLQSLRKPHVVMNAVNQHLKPNLISILACEETDQEFNARFSATGRRYLYRIINRRAPLTVDDGLAWLFKRPLEHEAMHEAAQVLVGRHDFTSFRAAACQAKSPLRTLDTLVVSRQGDEILIRTSARSFLHNQVRSMVGSLSLVGTGQWQKRDLIQALESRNRQAAGPNAPACGLYLTAVDYDS